MSRGKFKTKNSRTPLLCEENLVCISGKAPSVLQCRECGTSQCEDCDEELHKEGDAFFHERVRLDYSSSKTLAANDQSAGKSGKPHNSQVPNKEPTKKVPSSLPGGPNLPVPNKLTLNPPSSSSTTTITSSSTTSSKCAATRRNQEDRYPPATSSSITRNLVDVESNHHKKKLVSTNPGLSSGADNNIRYANNFSSHNKITATITYPQADHQLLGQPVLDYSPASDQGDSHTGASKEPSAFSSKEKTNDPWEPVDFEGPETNSGEYHSLGLDSILSSEFTSCSDMRGQSSKPSKKTKTKRSCSTLIQDAALGNHSSPTICTDQDDFSGPPCNGVVRTEQSDPLVDVPPNEFHIADLDGDEELVSNLIRSVQSDNHTTSQGSRLPDHATERRPASSLRSFLLIDESETLQVASGHDLVCKLNCAGADVKVVSIFGNTGDGKSYTLNHAFFGGKEVFATSADQDTCTVGVWTAYDPNTNVMCIDTEGLLGVSNNQNKRTRLLLKILAVSDVIIYRTSADRLHTDLFQFLGDASQAYSKHFKVELEVRKAHNGHKLVQEMGPVVVVFHETNRTNTLDMSGKGKSGDELLRERFVASEVDFSSFSAIKYVGVKTTKPPTNFNTLITSLKKEIENCSVRSPRSPTVVYAMLKVLNDKFKGDIYSHSPNSFPDEFFTCASKCLACTNRCSLSMNHKVNHHFSGDCKYVHAYDNRSYICKRCLVKGRKNEVVPKTCASGDNSVMGVAKYVFAGYVLECRECGVIYKSREHWYGNKDPTETAVQVEIKHIWPGQAAMPTGTHNAAWKLLDGVKVVADTVSAYGSKPTKMLSDWVADQVAPSYWVPNIDVLECHSCRHVFGEQEKKHHCRGCGSGFCDECTQFSKPVPERGWGPTPVRVCEKCHNLPPGAVALGEERGQGDNNSLMPRQIVENVQSVLGAVASVAIDYPIEVIKDSARPAYWIPDHLIKSCHQCQADFGPKLTIHHCRACGHGVCSACSARKRHVPSRGWDTFVRVCDACYKKEGAL